MELVKLTAPADSMKETENMCRDVEGLLSLLELPYRKLLLCSGDTGFAASITYDLEVRLCICSVCDIVCILLESGFYNWTVCFILQIFYCNLCY